MADKGFFETLQKNLADSGLKISKQGTKVIFGICVNAIFNEVKEEGSMRLPSGFGAFKIRRLKATEKKTPKSEERVAVPERNVLRYVMGKTVKNLIN